jgi:hypothetical protein
MHPMNGHAVSDFLSWDPSKLYRVPKFDTFIDLSIHFRRPVDQTWVLIILGVVNSRELGFAAGVGTPALATIRQAGTFDFSKDRVTASNDVFTEAAVPIGSVVDVENLHRVSIRQLLDDSDESSDASVNGQVKRLEVDITALNQAPQVVHPKLRSAHSCCRVQ